MTRTPIFIAAASSLAAAFLFSLAASGQELPSVFAPGGAAGQTPANPPSALTGEARAAELVKQYSHSLAFVEGTNGQGSGFIVEGGGQRALLTNQHVVAGNQGARFVLLDGTAVRAGLANAAVGHDIMRYAVAQEVKGLQVLGNLDQTTSIGDEIVVLGNLEGARVIKPLLGKIVGLGPNLVEVTAEFLPGNSGSPIIHLRTGKVIGVATYLTVRNEGELIGQKSDRKQIRRFGYRLDSVKEWQQVNWPTFHEEAATVMKVEGFTMELARLLDAMASGQLSPTNHQHPAIQRPLAAFIEKTGKGSMSVPDRNRAVQDLLSSLRSATQTDIVQANSRLRYDFFRRQIGEQQQARTQFYKVFDELVKARR